MCGEERKVLARDDARRAAELSEATVLLPAAGSQIFQRPTMVDVGHFDHIFKILLIGDAGVGKSSILLRFTDDAFEEHLASTIGVDFKVKTVQLGGKTVKLTIWDTAGQERFRTLTSSYYRGCHGIILVFDVNERSSFDNLKQWLDELELYSTTAHSSKLLVGNKIDLEDRQVTEQEATDFARQQAMMYLECSARTRVGIRQAFEEVVLKILDTPALLEAMGRGANLTQQPAEAAGCSC